MSNNIEGKAVVITGASSGLGAAAARHLSEKGARVALAARRAERIESLAEDITNHSGEARAIPTDVTEREEVEALVDATVEAFGRVDVMLNNAGIMPLSPLDRLNVDEWEQMIDVNVKGVLYGIAAALPYMQEQESGHIINVSSVAGHVVSPGSAVYSATKYAVRALSEGLRQEVKGHGLRTTIISPGAVDTELPDSISEEDIYQNIHEYVDEHAVPADSFARAVAFAIEQPEEVDVNEILYRPTSQEL